MLTNFLKVTIRNLYREKMYALINISGLALAIACCLILGLWLRSELTYDQHHIRHKEIFRVVNEFINNGKIDSYATTSKLLGPMLTEEYPEIKGFVRFRPIGEDIILPGDNYIDCTVYMADDNVFDVFTHDIIYGDPKTALLDPSGVVVSESFAKKYFNKANPIGETIIVGENIYKITLVFADLPENSHLKYDMLISYNSDEMDYSDPRERSRRLWGVLDFTYLLMPEDYNVRDFKEISDSFYANRMEAIRKNINITWRCWLQPLADIHLQSDVGYDLPTGNKLYLYGFAAVAFFILLVACINYMNLATARAAKRAKEVGMRKILGSGRVCLMFQFLGESIFFSLIAMFLGIVLLEVALKLTTINELLSKPLGLYLGHEPGLLGWMFVFSLGIGLLSGLYPALYLSSMPPLSAIMHKHRAGKGSIRLRELLVLIQFIISVSVIASTLLMALQMRYISHKPLGFNKDNKVIITLKGADLIDKMPTIKKALLKNSSISGVSLISYRFGGSNMPILTAQIDNNDGVPEMTSLKYVQVEDDFIEVMGMELIAGRDFSKKLLTDKEKAFIVNETMVKKMGWDDPLAKRFQIADGRNGRVIGVVKDFHFASLHSQVEPFALNIVSGNMNIPDPVRLSIRMYMVLNIKGDDISRTLNFLKDKLAEFDPMHPFKLEFLDDSLNKLYLSEQRLMKLIGLSAGVCVLISCMGLFGLSAFATEQRTKEIGIRKVLGATTWQIITMLSRRIILLVLGGAVVASFAAYYAMDEWLSRFSYHTDINPVVFIISAIIAAGVAFITVALQSYKTALANPVEALRYE